MSLKKFESYGEYFDCYNAEIHGKYTPYSYVPDINSENIKKQAYLHGLRKVLDKALEHVPEQELQEYITQYIVNHEEKDQ